MKVTDVEQRAPGPGTPLGRVKLYRMQVVATANYVSVMFANAWVRFHQLSKGSQRTVLVKELVLKERVERAQPPSQTTRPSRVVIQFAAHRRDCLSHDWPRRHRLYCKTLCRVGVSADGKRIHLVRAGRSVHRCTPHRPWALKVRPQSVEREAACVASLESAHACVRQILNTGHASRFAARMQATLSQPAPPGRPARPRRNRQAGAPAD